MRGKLWRRLDGAPVSKSEVGEARPQHGAFEGRRGRVQARLHALVGLNMFPKSGHFGLDPFFFSRLSGQVSSRGTRSGRNLKPKPREIDGRIRTN